LNSGAPQPSPKRAQERVLGIQRKLHRWSTDDQDRRFQDLHNLVCDPATLMVAWQRVRANRGSRSAGVDGQTARYIEQVLGVEKFLDGLREELRSGSFRPLPVKERLIPKRGGTKKFRRLGVPSLRDRVVQAALKLVLEPIFEADFQPCSYGYRPGRRTQDAIAEIHFLTTSPRSYEWIVEGDIKACFDELSHSAILDRVRRRIQDRRVLTLIKAFLKAGIMTEQGRLQGTVTGTPQGGILSPLMANVALSALDEHHAQAWEATGHRRLARRRRGEANYRIVRYADDFVIVVDGERRHAEALIAETEQVIMPLGLALSQEKTSIAHIDEGIEFLGWRIQRQTGRNGRPQIYTYPSKPSLQAVMGKVKQITRTGPNQTLDQLLHRLNPVLRGWCDHFRHGVSSQTFNYLRAYVWRRVIIWLRHKHHGRNWRWLRHRYLPGWWPTAETVSLYNPAGVKTTRYRYRGSKIPTPWDQPDYEQLSFDLERLEALIAR